VVVFNASELDLPWVLPDVTWGRRWVVDLDTAETSAGTQNHPSREAFADATIQVPSRSLVVLRRTS